MGSPCRIGAALGVWESTEEVFDGMLVSDGISRHASAWLRADDIMSWQRTTSGRRHHGVHGRRFAALLCTDARCGDNTKVDASEVIGNALLAPPVPWESVVHGHGLRGVSSLAADTEVAGNPKDGHLVWAWPSLKSPRGGTSS